MTDFLTRLAERQIGQNRTIEPRVAPLYALPANRFESGLIVEESEHSRIPEPSNIGFAPSLLQPKEKASPADQPSRESHHSDTGQSYAKGKAGQGEATPHNYDRVHLVSPALVASSMSADRLSDFPSRYKPEADTGTPVSLICTPDRRHRVGRNEEEAPVHVTIGRIEVTAVTAAPLPKRVAAPRKQGMSLDEYLARRQRKEM